MPLNRPTLATIVARVKNDFSTRLTSSTPLLKYTVVNALSYVIAAIAHSIYGALQYVSNNILPDKATGEWLARHGVPRGVFQISASYASGSLRFTGVNGTNIPSGTRAVSDSGVEYSTNAIGTISSGVADIGVTAVTPGTSGNIQSGSLLQLTSPISGIDTIVTCVTSITNANDLETEESYRNRIIQFMRKRSMGGSDADYVEWALAANSEVKRVWPLGNYAGLGTVVVIIGSAENDPTLGSGVISDVEDYLTQPSIAPLGVLITVGTVTPISYNFDISIEPNNSTTQTAVTSAIREVFKTFEVKGNKPAPAGIVYLSQLREAIASIPDIVNVTITDIERISTSIGVVDLSLNNVEYPVLGSITWSGY